MQSTVRTNRMMMRMSCVVKSALLPDVFSTLHSDLD